MRSCICKNRIYNFKEGRIYKYYIDNDLYQDFLNSGFHSINKMLRVFDDGGFPYYFFTYNTSIPDSEKSDFDSYFDDLTEIRKKKLEKLNLLD